MINSIFSFNDYREYLKAKIEENKSGRGYRVKLANAAGCQRSILSQTLRGALDLTRDQAAGLCEFWSFSDIETEYFLCLVDSVRSKSTSLKNFMNRRLSDIKAQYLDLSKRVTKEKINTDAVALFYYSSWIPSAVHIALSIPELSKEEKLAKRLDLPVALVNKTLRQLREMGLVSQKDSKWQIENVDLNLPSLSPLREINHVNWRQRAIIDVQKQNKDSIHYSSIFSMSRKDAKWLKEKTQQLILQAREKIASSKEEEIFCMNCDFFEI